MLELERAAVSPRARRAQTAALPRTEPRKATGSAQPAPGRPAPRQAPAPRAGRARLANSEGRLMAIAVVCTAVLCGILVLYLAAYARVTSLGIAQSQARTLLRQKRLENETLRAERDRLESPTRVLAAAAAQGMTRTKTPVIYITPGQARADTNAGGAGTNLGTTPPAFTAFNDH